ncbi:hypothetical protein I4F81_004528 [Pyropia yezoensis]|uniref:Uncharacterized protein n=1 Tax=Pyropia yezoensis TaxID=2788 RepID=A0ACC3BVP0_PYRYE|nr:hypothetical protein I4F81_004528 [Neopyropia yezoensis]
MCSRHGPLFPRRRTRHRRHCHGRRRHRLHGSRPFPTTDEAAAAATAPRNDYDAHRNAEQGTVGRSVCRGGCRRLQPPRPVSSLAVEGGRPRPSRFPPPAAARPLATGAWAERGKGGIAPLPPLIWSGAGTYWGCAKRW